MRENTSKYTNRRGFLKTAGAVTAVGLAGCSGNDSNGSDGSDSGGDGSDGEPEKTDMNVLITFIPDMHYAPVMGAAEFGYWDDLGVNVTVESGSGENPIQLLTSGEYDAIVTGPTEQIIGRARDIPVRTLLTRTANTPAAFLSVGDGPTSLDEFPGLTLGWPNEPDIKSYSQAILQSEFSESEREQMETVFTGFAMSNLLTEKVDAMTVFETNADVTSLQVVDDITLNAIPHNDYINAPGNVCLTTEDFLSQNPNSARELARGYCRSLIETLKPENMDQYMDMTIQNLDEADANVYIEGAEPRPVQEAIYERFLNLRPSPEWGENGAGWNNPADFADVQEMLTNIGVVSEEAQLSEEELVQNEVINDIYDDQGRLIWNDERIEVPV